MNINHIYNEDCVLGMTQIDGNSVDLTITSPPYDDLRTYNGFRWDFDSTARELYRITKDGGVVVWVTGDATSNFAESLTSFKQAIGFVEVGFKLLDTMIYAKTNYAPAYPTMRRYAQTFEYMFVLVKGGKPKTFNPIKTHKQASTVGVTQTSTFRQRDGTLQRKRMTVRDIEKHECNVWVYDVGYMHSTTDRDAFNHPAIFPEQLAKDHILTWSNEGDLVLDPFMGSGTTAKMALATGRRYVGFEISRAYCDLANARLTRVSYDALPQNTNDSL